jgi:hypothetical protein
MNISAAFSTSGCSAVEPNAVTEPETPVPVAAGCVDSAAELSLVVAAVCVDVAAWLSGAFAGVWPHAARDIGRTSAAIIAADFKNEFFFINLTSKSFFLVFIFDVLSV